MVRVWIAAAIIGLSCVGSAFAQSRPSLEQAFEDAQLASAPGAGVALADGAARIAAADPALKTVFEAHREAEARRRALETVLASLRAQGAPAAERARGVAADLEQATLEAAGLRQRLDQTFPAFADLTDPAPLTIAEVQALLNPEEALVLILPTERGVYVWGVTHETAVWRRSDMTAGEVEQAASRLQAGLRAEGGRGAVDAARPGRSAGGFDRASAYALYRALWQPLEATLSDRRLVYVVVDGPLRSVPPGVLVTAAPSGDDRDPAALRATAWLERRHAFALLPAVVSLKAARRATREGERGFIGFGAVDTQAYPEGTQPKALAPLPGTRRELEGLARVLGSPRRTVRLGNDATEGAVRRADLSGAAVIAFATHALPGRDERAVGAQEPALVLTPSALTEGDDDGLLTASEAARLRLNADLVILSACDTGRDDPQAQGLNSLSRAFFYAGARALMVSNWRIRDDVAERLSVRAVTLAHRNRQGVSEALHRAALEMMEDRSDPSFAHPSQWSSFSVVGDGAVRINGG
nr:CHAT domain-containing protein [uncultured Brevundimonas sp.]